MKKIKRELTAYVPNAENYIERVVEDYVDVKCMHCGQSIKFTETLINSMQGKAIDRAIKDLYNFMSEVETAITEVYGDDPRRIMLERKLKEIQKKYLALRVVK